MTRSVLAVALSALWLPFAFAAEDKVLPPGHPNLGGSAPPDRANAGDLPAGHPKVREGSAAPSAEELLKQLDSTKDLKERQKTFEVAAALGKLYYSHARYKDAVEYLSQAVEKSEPTRAIFLEAKGKAHKPAAAGCPAESTRTLEAASGAASHLAKKGDFAAAAGCALTALEPGLEVEELRANARFLTGDAQGALTGYERVLQISEASPNSLFGHAAVLFDARGNDLKALRRAKEELARFLNLAPQSPRAAEAKKLLARTDEAIAAGGQDRLAQKRAGERKSAPVAAASASIERPPGPPTKGDQPPALTKEMVEAVQNTERTPELLQGLAKLVDEGEEHLARGRYQDALDAYKRVVPFQPENGRAKAGMAWALVGLKKPMADRVWSVAVSGDPASVEKLGDALTAKGDKAGARALWSKLAETSPSYANGSGLRGKLR